MSLVHIINSITPTNVNHCWDLAKFSSSQWSWKNQGSTYVGLQPWVKLRGGLKPLVAFPALSSSSLPSFSCNDNLCRLLLRVFRWYWWKLDNADAVSLTMRTGDARGYCSKYFSWHWTLRRDFLQSASRHIVEHTLCEVELGIEVFFEMLDSTNVPHVSLQGIYISITKVESIEQISFLVS